MESESTHRIAIIGGGLSGASILIGLLRSPHHRRLVITVFEPREVLGTGIAYGDAAPWHLLNVVANRASLEPDDPDHWWKWARIYGPQFGWPGCVKAGPESYLPRRLFGHYAAEQVKLAIEHADWVGRDRITVIHKTPHDLQCTADGAYEVRADGETLIVDSVVLATGMPTPAPDLPGVDAIRAAGRFIDNPWDIAGLGRIASDAPVLIIGSGLTMADTVVSLHRTGHRGSIHVLSRHGVVPVARQHCKPTPPCLTPDGGDRRLSALLAELRRAIQAAGLENWQAVVEGLRPVTQSLWLGLSDAERQRFSRHLKTYWDAHRFRMPPATAAIVDKARKDGQLIQLRGRLEALQPSDEGVMVRYRTRGSHRTDELRAATVIACTGPAPAEAGDERDLISSMRRNGLLRLDGTRLGWEAAANGQLRAPDGAIQRRLYTIGPPLRSALLECTSIADIREQASAIARELCTAYVDSVENLFYSEALP